MKPSTSKRGATAASPSPRPRRAARRGDGLQLGELLRAEIEAIAARMPPPPRAALGLERHLPAPLGELVDARSARVADDRVGLRRREHLAELVRRVPLQLPPPDRERAEELRDRDRRADVTRDRRALRHAPVGTKGEQCAGGIVLGSGGDRERRQRGQAIQRLATEPERAQPLQVVKLLELGSVVAEATPSRLSRGCPCRYRRPRAAPPAP